MGLDPLPAQRHSARIDREDLALQQAQLAGVYSAMERPQQGPPEALAALAATTILTMPLQGDSSARHQSPLLELPIPAVVVYLGGEVAEGALARRTIRPPVPLVNQIAQPLA